MNFCGTRIKTAQAERKSTKKLKFLEVQKGMWKPEKQAIKEHNDQVRLQNKGALLTTLKTFPDMSFLGKVDLNKNPVFGVFPTTTFECQLEITLNSDGKLASFSCGLPKIIGNGYRVGLKRKKLSDKYRRYTLEATFVGLLPQKTKDKITVLKEAGVPTFLIADTHWKETETKPPNPDPIVIAVYNKKVYMVDVFDASIRENYVAHELTEDPEETE